MAKIKSPEDLWQDFKDNWAISSGDLKKIAGLQLGIFKKKAGEKEYRQKLEALKNENRQKIEGEGYKYFNRLQAGGENLARLGLNTSGIASEIKRQNEAELQKTQKGLKEDYSREAQEIGAKLAALKRDILEAESNLKFLETGYKKINKN